MSRANGKPKRPTDPAAGMRAEVRRLRAEKKKLLDGLAVYYRHEANLKESANLLSEAVEASPDGVGAIIANARALLRHH